MRPHTATHMTETEATSSPMANSAFNDTADGLFNAGCLNRTFREDSPEYDFVTMREGLEEQDHREGLERRENHQRISNHSILTHHHHHHDHASQNQRQSRGVSPPLTEEILGDASGSTLTLETEPEQDLTRIIINSGLNNTNQSNTSARTLFPEPVRIFGSNSRRAMRGLWNSNVSPFFATLVCCLNFYTLCRFSILTYFLKGSFIFQFMVISIFFGLPFLLFLMSLGRYLGSGYMDMWFISPIFKGIGLAFMLSYAMISIYTIIPISWLLVFLRDSFLTTREAPYKWTYCNRRFNSERCLKAWNTSRLSNDNTHLGWSISAYFHNTVMGHQDNGFSSTYAKLNVILNLALLWILTFVILFRGLHNSGRVVNFLAVFPLAIFVLTAVRFIEEFGEGVVFLFFSDGKPFLGDLQSWVLAARECFMVWSLFGAVVINVYGHSKPANLIRHSAALFIIVTVILLISACFFASTFQIIMNENLQYTFSSFEEYSTTNFIHDGTQSAPGLQSVPGLPPRLETACNLIIGENLMSSSDLRSRRSNYQVLRWATEVMPLALALKGPKAISSFWAMTFYLSGVLSCFATHLVVWGSLVGSIISLAPESLRQTKSTVSFIAAFLGFAASVTINSSKSASVVYFLDSCLGSVCWIACLYLVMVVAILVVRGKPCAPYHLVSSLNMKNKLFTWLLPILTLHWTLVLPIILMILSILYTRSYGGLKFSQVMDDYPYWTPQIRVFWEVIQPMPLLIVVLYLITRLMLVLCVNRNIQLRLRLRNLFAPEVTIYEPEISYAGQISQISTIEQNSVTLPDPPPKYSPPPSYSSATAKPLTKQFRSRFASSITIDLHFLRDVDSNGNTSSCYKPSSRKKLSVRRKSSNKL